MKSTWPMRWPAHLPRDRALDRGDQPVVEVGRVEPAVGAQLGAEVGLVEREQARAELTLGGDAHAVAALAERLGHARDHADVAAPVEVAPARGGLDVRAADRLEREHRADALDDLARGHDLSPRSTRPARRAA